MGVVELEVGADVDDERALPPLAVDLPRGEPRDYDLTGNAEQIAEKVDAYRAAGLDQLVLNTSTQESSAQMLEAVDFFAREVRPLLPS